MASSWRAAMLLLGALHDRPLAIGPDITKNNNDKNKDIMRLLDETIFNLSYANRKPNPNQMKITEYDRILPKRT